MKKVCKPMDIPGIKACRNNRGYIVVFMSLILLVLMIIVTAVLEIAKLDSGKTKAAAALSTTESDMLAKYQKLCFERYHLLVCDLSDGGKGEAATEEMMKNHLQENLGDELTVDDIAFAGQEYFLEDDYAEFKKQISDQAYYQAALAAVNAIETKTGGQDEPVDHDTIQEMDDDVDNTKEVRELEGMEEEEEAEKSGTELVEKTVDSDVEDPRETLKTFTASGIPALIQPNELIFSNNQISQEDDIPSETCDSSVFSDINTDFDNYTTLKSDTTKENGWGQSLVNYGEAIAYASSVFNCATDVKYDDTYLNLELEYLVGGKPNDADNYESVVRQMIALRLGPNFAYLLTDAEKMASLEALSTAICAAAPFLQPACKYLLAGCWAYFESVLDVYYLLRGKKIPYFKDWNSWMTDLEHLGQFQDAECKEDEDGMSYKDYLMILIALHGNTIYPRMLDLIQLNVRQKDIEGGDPNFKFENTVTAFGMDATVSMGESSFYLHEEAGY